ncbi:hypothetical protein HGG64_01555 [Mycoplasma phocoeninasale]|uniref:Uncharacterized protein n=1 Tax=Mycoplasma phocoeninasale TaxID=2726117 RepID=A0A858U585_9MOLU|nr:hypothetical protein [Mycoplasma phocoeninasale]QJG66393.1 hypothetical protein HGG64_01555 [Mycoplasma phocoeninasale]
MLKQDPQNKGVLENGVDFFSKFYEYVENCKDSKEIENLLDSYPRFKKLMEDKTAALLQKIFELPEIDSFDFEKKEKNRKINPLQSLLNFLLEYKEIKYYSYLTLISTKILLEISINEIQNENNRLTIEMKKHLKILNKVFKEKSGFSREELEVFFNHIIDEINKSNEQEP